MSLSEKRFYVERAGPNSTWRIKACSGKVRYNLKEISRSLLLNSFFFIYTSTRMPRAEAGTPKAIANRMKVIEFHD